LKTGGYQSEKGNEKRTHRGSHHDLTNDWNLCVFTSDGVFGNHRLSGRVKRLLIPGVALGMADMVMKVMIDAPTSLRLGLLNDVLAGGTGIFRVHRDHRNAAPPIAPRRARLNRTHLGNGGNDAVGMRFGRSFDESSLNLRRESVRAQMLHVDLVSRSCVMPAFAEDLPENIAQNLVCNQANLSFFDCAPPRSHSYVIGTMIAVEICSRRCRND
jgi:hypothetical protein